MKFSCINFLQLPESIKYILRFFYYKNQRKKFFREITIKRKQDKFISLQYDKDEKALIVFLVPGADWNTGKDNISGGVLSIASLYNETKKLFKVHNSKTLMCTFPGDHLLFDHTGFENDITVFRFKQLSEYFTSVKKMIIHIPELLVEYFKPALTKYECDFLKSIECLQINILNQNINLMPGKKVIDSLQFFTKNITVTTAHKKYCTKDYRLQYSVPLHFFSTFADPGNYDFIQYSQKEDLIIFSPDQDEKNKEIIALLKSAFPNLQTQVIRGLKYEDYKELIKRSKWSITFGEGLDFYFIEPVFSGAISFAIYNEAFFTEDFKTIKGIYPDYDELCKKIVSDIKDLDNPVNYKKYQQEQFDLCALYYSKQQYAKNIAAFYSGQYTYA